MKRHGFKNAARPKILIVPVLFIYICIASICPELGWAGSNTDPPIILFDKIKLEFTGITNLPAPPAQTLTISNNKGSEMNWTAETTVDWLEVEPAKGGNNTTIKVSVRHYWIDEPGIHNAFITIKDPDYTNSPITILVTVKLINRQPGKIVVNRKNLYFSGFKSVNRRVFQSIRFYGTGLHPLWWEARANYFSWLSFEHRSGTGDAEIPDIHVNTAGREYGTYREVISISDSKAENSPQYVNVYLTIKPISEDIPPFGSLDTPVDGSIVEGSIPVTGWALDDVGIQSVKIYRNPVNDEPDSLIYIGDAVFVEDARPDIANAYPEYPLYYKAGWGYMLLTNMLPDQGNRSFTLTAIASDIMGNITVLGKSEIYADNANAVNPFGAIDNPRQGEVISGQWFNTTGWLLTPQPNTIPFDGSTIMVWVDGIPQGHPTYNLQRLDIPYLFPGYNNSEKPHAYFHLDTTTHENGVHTIAWSVEDDAGNKSGIGSRYFTIQNDNVGRVQGSNHYLGENEYSDESPAWDKREITSKAEKKGNLNLHEISISANPLEPMEINLFPILKQNSHIRIRTLNHSPLPTGATLDYQKGILYWLPGPAFAGEHIFYFTAHLGDGTILSKSLRVNFDTGN